MDVKEKQHAVIEFPLLEGCPGDEILTRLPNVYGPDAYSRSSVFHWIQEVRRGNEELRNEGRPGRPPRHEVDASIRSILQDNPNASLSTIANASQTCPETVRNHMSRIGHVLKCLHWIPQALRSELKQVRKNVCLRMLPKLRAYARNGWHNIVTGDESWFYHEYVRERIWTAMDDNAPKWHTGRSHPRKAC
jgi:nucleoside-diphosphate-sugar epimerase